MSNPFAIILVAAGASTRMGFPKLWADLNGAPLLARAIAAACQARPDELILVVGADRLSAAAKLAPTAHVVSGGDRRRDSVGAGLAAATTEWIAIHDAARALAPASLYVDGLEAARSTGAAIPVVPLKDTVKRLANERVVETIARSQHAAVQTPQIFRRDILERALALTDDDVTDEAALVEQLGIDVATFPGDERAFKVTTPLDLALVRALLA
jgi:2-C-methyl-D-erythritol 4-phosphate cytidylyltransferase / 2-C-methyl-D-erythritol 2,4-cyclodiphosphate synthase